jgi:hypothetical protein
MDDTRGEQESADVAHNERSDEEYVDPPSQPRSRWTSRGRDGERTERHRAAARQRAREARATETEEERVRRLASNLASVRARRERIHAENDEEMRLLQEEARRRAAEGSGARTAPGQDEDDINDRRLLFYQLTLPAEGPHLPLLIYLFHRNSQSDHSARDRCFYSQFSLGLLGTVDHVWVRCVRSAGDVTACAYGSGPVGLQNTRSRRPSRPW